MWWGQHMYGLGWGGWLAGGLMMLLFWGILIALVFFGIRAFSNNGSKNSQPANDTALSILRKRYAQGEISQEEFETIRQNLTE